jgi:hypothetical protein
MDTGIGAFTRSDNSTNKRVCNTTMMLAGVEGIITLEQAMERPLLRFFTTSVDPYGANGALHTVFGAPLKLLKVAWPVSFALSPLG